MTNATVSFVNGKTMHYLLWLAQICIFLSFGWAAYMKLFVPLAELGQLWPWTTEVPVAVVRVVAIVDALGALGVVLPSLLRIKPGLVVWAALGCILLQLCALVFHWLRGEVDVIPVNLVYLAIGVFIVWGRSQWRPITAR